LRPLTGQDDVALRLVGVDDAADARIISKSLLDADERFIPCGSNAMSRHCGRRILSP